LKIFEEEYGHFTCDDIAFRFNLRAMHVGKAFKKLEELNLIHCRVSCNESNPVYWYIGDR